MKTNIKIILARKTKVLLGEEINYILFAEGDPDARFGISVEFKGEMSVHPLGTQAETAFCIFRRISEGNVTPCTLSDVARDLELEALY